MIIENVEENRKKTISYSFKPPIWLQFRIGADIRKATRAEPCQQAIYDALGISDRPGEPRKPSCSIRYPTA